MMAGQNDLLLAFYGDDFTGSTDALEFLSRAGVRTVLFMEPPGPEQLSRYPGLQAVGVAGMSRSMSPENMEKVLRPAFKALSALGAPHIHYKVCSTFDSSPRVGSIGKAIDIGADVFKAAFVPVAGGAPALGRYCVFGNLFARLGIGSGGAIYRLDRHPSMSRHPVTPSDESDLRMHLSRQTVKRIGLLDILQLDRPGDQTIQTLQAIINAGADVVLIDTLYEAQLGGIGHLLDRYATTERPLFSVGSSAIEMALGNHWIQEGRLTRGQDWTAPGKAAPLLVVSGSCSPVTAGQITWAMAHGFAEIALDAEAIVNGGTTLLYGYVHTAVSLMEEGRSVILHTGRKMIATTTGPAAGTTTGLAAVSQATTAEVLGAYLGRIVSAIATRTRVKRLVIAGGDTSSYAARALGIEAVEMICPLSPGAPLCRAYAPGSPVDGMEINVKGGQVGGEDYFGNVLEGK
jgi:uncharacterized protein YgbK (DUF1537 family)